MGGILDTACQQGFLYAIAVLGIVLTLRVLNWPDLTVDGSFTLGICVTAVATVAGHPLLGFALSFFCGAAAGILTGLLHTKVGIHPLLAGILTMTGLYSINLAVMGGSPNISLLRTDTVFTILRRAMPGIDRATLTLVIVAFISAVCTALLAWFFLTGLGLRIRAAGDNAAMVRASSINSDATHILATALTNAFVGLAGAVLAQYQGYADINSGAGVIVVGLASIIIGEVVVRGQNIVFGLLAAVFGAVAYRLLIALALYANFFPAYMLRFVSAVIVSATLAVPQVRETVKNSNIKKRGRRHAGTG